MRNIQTIMSSLSSLRKLQLNLIFKNSLYLHLNCSSVFLAYYKFKVRKTLFYSIPAPNYLLIYTYKFKERTKIAIIPLNLFKDNIVLISHFSKILS